MTEEYERKVGKRGQVTIPKEIRRRWDLSDGDEVVMVETEKGVLITAPVDRSELATGYRERTDRSVELMQELESASAEADERLGNAPAWEDE